MLLAAKSNEGLRYRLRIVCPEGAVVRDGIEIDSCASVGSMEMGEIAEAFDRCVNFFVLYLVVIKVSPCE